MHLNLNSAFAVRQNNCTNDLERGKTTGDKYEMTPGQAAHLAAMEAKGIPDSAPTFC